MDTQPAAGMQPAIELIRGQRGLMARIGRELGLSGPAVRSWRRVPAERLAEVERVTGIPRHMLRPDVCLPPCRCGSYLMVAGE